MSDESLVQMVARRWCKWPTAEGPCVAHVARAREMVSDLRLAGVDVTSPVDRLRKAGWTECGTCVIYGYALPGFGGKCTDCAHGLIPPDGMVDAAAEAIWHRRHDVPYRPGRPRHNKYHDDYLRDARAALVAAARWEAPE